MNTSCIIFLGQADENEYWLNTLSISLVAYGTIKIISERFVETIGHLECQPRLVIIDSGSVGNLLEMVAEVRRSIPRSKILVVSASPLWKEVRQVIYAGADDYCQKSLDKNGILEHVEQLIGKQPERR